MLSIQTTSVLKEVLFVFGSVKQILLRMQNVCLLSVFFMFISTGYADTLRVGVSADFHHTMVDIATMFQKRHQEHTVEVSEIESSELSDSVVCDKNPCDMLVIDDKTAIKRLESKKRIVPGSAKTYAFGRLAYWHRGQIPPGESVEDYVFEHTPPTATISTEESPYGVRARDVLASIGVLKTYDSQGLLRVHTHDQDHNDDQDTWDTNKNSTEPFALLPASWLIHSATDHPVDIHEHPYPDEDEIWLIPEEYFLRLEQKLAIMKGSTVRETAQQLSDFILSDDIQSYIANHGYHPANYYTKKTVSSDFGAGYGVGTLVTIAVSALGIAVLAWWQPQWIVSALTKTGRYKPLESTTGGDDLPI